MESKVDTNWKEERKIMFFMAIIGDRKRTENQTDADVVRKLIEDEIPKPGPMPVFVSVGCDMGIGKLVKSICAEHGLPFCELSCIFQCFETALRRGGHVEAYLARNMSIYHLCQMFHLFVRSGRQGIIENLVSLLNDNPKDYAVIVYDESNSVVQTMGFQEEEESNEEDKEESSATSDGPNADDTTDE